MRKKRDLVTIDDLRDEEIERLFALADELLDGMADPDVPHRVRGRSSLAADSILSTLFFEPSTRTRFSFESAMIRLGGRVLAFGDPGTTSAAKGESIADTVRVIENYADLIVMRHPSEGAARLAADFAGVPVINAGDGGHEHPTQTLCDLYTLRREKKKLRGLSVLLCGDLKNGRTVHSLVYALARFGAHIIPYPADGLGLPEHVQRRLETDYNCLPVPADKLREPSSSSSPVDIVYVTPGGPHQASLWPGPTSPPGGEVELSLKVRASATDEVTRLARKTLDAVDVCYVTRLQTERLTDPAGKYPVVDRKFLSGKQYRNTQVMHPLPRVDELAVEMDRDERGVYFKQAAYGVPVRMALMASLLGLRPGVLEEDGPVQRHPSYRGPKHIKCGNARCVTNLESERKYLLSKFRVVEPDRVVLRCEYCDYIREPASRRRTKRAERVGGAVGSA